MWSTMRKPGCKKREADMMRCVAGSTEPLINLDIVTINGCICKKFRQLTEVTQLLKQAR